MTSSIMSFVVGFDNFGHPAQLTYKGKQTFQTKLGGLCSIVIKVMTIVMVVIGLKSMMLMEDPEITSFTRFLTGKEKS